MVEMIIAIMVVIGLPVLCVTAVIIAALMAPGRRSRQADPEETRMIQEMHRGIEKLERRIDSLETIVLEHEGGERGAS